MPCAARATTLASPATKPASKLARCLRPVSSAISSKSAIPAASSSNASCRRDKSSTVLSANADPVCEAFDHRAQRGELHGLGEIVVHPRGKARLAIAFQRVLRHRDDGHVAAAQRLVAADL